MASVSSATAKARSALIERLTRRNGDVTYAHACNLNAAEIGDRKAVVDRRTSVTWAEAKQHSDRLAMALLERGVARPDVVLLHLPNCVEQFIIRLACEKAGIRVVLTSTSFRETELTSIVARARPRIAFVSASAAARGDYDRFRQAVQREDFSPDFVRVGGDAAAWGEAYSDLLATAPSSGADHVLERTRFRWDERFYLPTTSGSTSVPKMVDAIFGNRIGLSLEHARGVKLGFGETIAALPPVTSGTSDSLVHHAAPYFAATIVLEDRFSPTDSIDLLIDHGVHVATTVPTMLARMVAVGSIDRLREAPLRCFAVYASALSHELGTIVEKRAGCGIVRCYGTMDFGGISMSVLDQSSEERIRTVGKPFPGNDVRILDDAGCALPVGRVGEIAMRPNHFTMGGYYRDFAQTAEAWSEAYYKLGDVGVFDDSGNLVLVGRSKDLIIRGGQNVVPAEVEELVSTHPKVADVVVVGLPDSEMGERICACVIANGTDNISMDEIRAHFDRLGVARFKCPERVEMLREFPMTMSGIKVDRKALVRRLTEGKSD